MATNTRLTFQVDEMARVSELQHNLLRSAFNDTFYLLVCAAMILAEPLLSWLEGDQTFRLFWIFIGLLMTGFTMIAMNFMKQSIMLYYMSQLALYENALRESPAVDKDEDTFKLAHNWPAWSRTVHQPLAIAFFSILLLFWAVYPAVIMLHAGAVLYCLIYLLVFAVLTAALNKSAGKIIAQ